MLQMFGPEFCGAGDKYIAVVHGRSLGFFISWMESSPRCLLGGTLPTCFDSKQLTVIDQFPGVLTHPLVVNLSILDKARKAFSFSHTRAGAYVCRLIVISCEFD